MNFYFRVPASILSFVPEIEAPGREIKNSRTDFQTRGLQSRFLVRKSRPAESYRNTHRGKQIKLDLFVLEKERCCTKTRLFVPDRKINFVHHTLGAHTPTPHRTSISGFPYNFSKGGAQQKYDLSLELVVIWPFSGTLFASNICPLMCSPSIARAV